MQFQKEEGLVSTGRPELEEKFGSENSVSFEEFGYGGGRTDLVIAKLSPAYLERRLDDLELATPISSIHCLKAFTRLHRRGEITKDYFINELAKDDRVKSALDWLLSNGFVEEVRGKLRTVRNLRRHVTSTYAFEFKLRDWRRALEQAFRSKSYSKYQYVVMDGSFRDSVSNHLEAFEKYNIGLIFVSNEKGLSVEKKAAREDSTTPVSEWALNESTLSCQNIK